ncbi:MAG TPA: RnfABCDGE type electron transport complex subunit A [Candidatus Faeciplasma avium]|uniref:Ion-translocating oxidoreductase complex subunit A n=1 Tax=Candidatus Faeciplasma avium TaxID=2840798 RepID=A0A9D1NSB4_9FIRM|nr:RnfABCDGE type electron transport complex subunit A [Candidatus Faeciplasma avium]
MASCVLGIISAALVNNVVLSRFLGLCPFLGVSKKTSTAVGMGSAVIAVIAASSFVTFLVNRYILERLGLEYLRTIVFILIIAALVQAVEIVLKKKMPSLYKALGVYLPLITTNCAVLGVAIDSAQKGYDLVNTMIYSVGTAVGFLVAIVIMAGIRERIEHNDIPEAFKGMPIVLVTAGLMAIAFVGFSGTL